MGRKKQKVRWTTVEDGFFDSTDNNSTSNPNTVLKNSTNQSNNYVEYVESEYNSVSSGEFCEKIRETKIFLLSLRFCVKSILKNVEVVKLPFLFIW